VIDGLRFAEATRWFGGRVWCSDIHGHRVVAVDPSDPSAAAETVARLDDRPSGLGFLPDGTPLVVSMLDRRVLRIEPDGTTAVHGDGTHLCEEFLNDMVVDPRSGRAWVGCRNRGGGAEGPRDSLLLVEPDGRTAVAATGLQGPNGAVLTPDGRELIVAETPLGRLTSFPVGSDGRLGGRRTFAVVEGRHLDGICLDDDGTVWAGGVAAGLLRIAGGGGVVEQVTDPGGRLAISPVFGGPERRDLFVATASAELFPNLRAIGSDRTLDGGVDSGGRIEALAVSARGAGTP
jgi:sugar lactone lactonase YvrE